MTAPRRHAVGRVTLVRGYDSRPDTVPKARGLADRLDGLLDEQSLGLVRLVISELVTNAVRHGPGGTVAVRLSADPRAVLVEVTDSGDDGDIAVQPVADGPGGRGLLVVDAIAERWGVVRNEGTTVWAEVASDGS